MRSRILVPCAAVVVALLTVAAAALAQGTRHYSGRAGVSDVYTMSFVVSHGAVTRFTFQSRCPGLRDGSTVAARIRIARGRFRYHDQQFTITGRLLRNGMARGTERDVTGDCDSGTLGWAARTTTTPRFAG